MQRELYDDTHDMFRESVRSFAEREVVPHLDAWAADGIVDRSLFSKAGSAGFLCFQAPESLGGMGVDDYRFNVALGEMLIELGALDVAIGFALHNDVVLPYLLSANGDQRARWLPGMIRGDLIGAIAMTEPGTGSDLAGIATTAVLDGDEYIINGSKTFITNGINADFVIVVVKTDPSEPHRGMSLLVVERDTPGFTRGRNLDKLGQHGQDTAELFFDDVRVPVGNRLGEEGSGFLQLVSNLAQERLSVSVSAVAHATLAYGWALEYAKERTAFGRSVGSFQANRFTLAEMATELDIARTYVDAQVRALNAGTLTVEDAAAGKWWTTELQQRVVSRSLQLFGGYGYMSEYPISKAYTDARVTTIYGGTTEVMKEIVGRGLGV